MSQGVPWRRTTPHPRCARPLPGGEASSVLGLLLGQRARQFWNRLGRGPRRTRRLVGAFLAAVFTVGFVLLAGLNASLLVERVGRIDPVAATEALPVLLVGVFVLTLV